MFGAARGKCVGDTFDLIQRRSVKQRYLRNPFYL
jgi:hypothetical protein